ncbi:MAG: hypothetical protein E6I98_04520 [Chloroflexi bacterium]|nr:MAG: hypothetical protein E6I98_04520 [Chloroflexota bacterium]
MGISVNDSKLAELARLIEEWPGLVSAPADELIEDCLVLVSHVSDATTLVDVGSGGGLPGLALKIMVPRLAVTLVEADGRKAAFLTQACARLGLPGVRVVDRRAEDAAHDAGLREAFDVAVARGPLPAGPSSCWVAGRCRSSRPRRKRGGRGSSWWSRRWGPPRRPIRGEPGCLRAAPSRAARPGAAAAAAPTGWTGSPAEPAQPAPGQRPRPGSAGTGMESMRRERRSAATRTSAASDPGSRNGCQSP